MGIQASAFILALRGNRGATDCEQTKPKSKECQHGLMFLLEMVVDGGSVSGAAGLLWG